LPLRRLNGIPAEHRAELFRKYQEIREMTITATRVGCRVACGAAALIVAVSAVGAGGPAARAVTGPHARPGAPGRSIRHARDLRARAARGAPGARPWTIAIPSIGVDAGLMPLGGPALSAADRSLPTPPLAKAATAAAWYRFSAVPGTPGNAVIVGHVDTYAGPGVFYRLYQVRPGDAIYVSDGGATQRFDVTAAREMPKSRFPVNQVFGGTKNHLLWLITCGGAFDYRTRHYLDNILVSAVWAPPAH
jgi:hypothetical protein